MATSRVMLGPINFWPTDLVTFKLFVTSLCVVFWDKAPDNDISQDTGVTPQWTRDTSSTGNNNSSYLATSVSKQDETDPVSWLATRAGKMALSCPLRITCCVPEENSVHFPYNKSFIDQACSDKMAGYWPHSLLCVYGPRQWTWPISSHPDLTLGPAYNPYILPASCYRNWSGIW